jgi:glycerol-3-phosphate acyltransferase PlsY
VRIVLPLLVGYLIGGFPTGILLCRLLRGVDPRKIGSGSSGATNVSRVLGRAWGTVVLVLDGLKGYLPVRFLVPAMVPPEQVVIGSLCMAAGVIVGHVWTPYARFHGGKGVAAATGALLAIDYTGVLIALGVWLVVFLPFRLVSLASLAASLSLPVAMLLLGGRPVAYIMAAAVLSLLMIFTHRRNIVRLLHREEKPLF